MSTPSTKAAALRPEDYLNIDGRLSDEEIAIRDVVRSFVRDRVEPNVAEWFEEGRSPVDLMKELGAIGVLGMHLEGYGCAGTSATAYGLACMELEAGDSGIRSLVSVQGSLAMFAIHRWGSEEQRERWLPPMAAGEAIGCFGLTEPDAGSDPGAMRTRARRDGTDWILNGQKMWITNGGAADLFTVFAKVGGEKFTAFLVERNFPGVSSGAEEHKMGITGSSTTAVYLDNVPVPVENVLGEIGRGHVIAFNILNIGRLKLGPATVGAAKNVLAISLKYAKQRKAFGSAIAEFGAIQHKLAEMAIRIFVAESMTWRVVGLIENQMHGAAVESTNAPANASRDNSTQELKAIEEFAAECSMVKVYAAEMLDYVVDEGVQIHGGYGYHQDYAVERAYRDSRINRLFEGTSEINRLVITGMPLKRAARGLLPLFEAARAVLQESDSPVAAGESKSEDPELSLVHKAKKIALLTLGVAHEKYSADLEKQQEIIMNLSDIIMEVFAMESSLLRSRKLAAAGSGVNAADACAVYLRDAIAKIELSSRTVLSACAQGDELRRNLSRVRGYASHDPVNAIALRRQIAGRLLANERYTV